MGLKIAQGEWINFSVAQVPPDDLAAGYVIYLLGSLAVHIGLNYMRPFENRKWGGPAERSPVSFAGIAALWLLGVTYLFEASWFSGLGNISRPLGWMALDALSLFVLVPREHGYFEEDLRRALFIGTAGLLVANIRSGSKRSSCFRSSDDLDAVGSARSAAVEHADRNRSAIVLLRRRFSRSGAVACGPGPGKRDRLHSSYRFVRVRRRESAPDDLNGTRTN